MGTRSRDWHFQVMVTETDPNDDKIIRNLCRNTGVDRASNCLVLSGKK